MRTDEVKAHQYCRIQQLRRELVSFSNEAVPVSV